MLAFTLSPWHAARNSERMAIEMLPCASKAILAAKVEALWKTASYMGIGLFLGTPYLVIVCESLVPSRPILIWACCVALTVCVRLIAYRRFLRTPVDSRDDVVWLRRFRVLFPLTAFVYGLLPVVVLPVDATALQMGFGFIAVLTVSAVTLAFCAGYDLVAFSVYNVALFLPLFSFVVYTGRWLEGVLMAAMIVFLLLVGRRTHAIVSSAFEAREALKIEKAAAELAREEADRANREKSRFLAAASHDLRQPMHALTLFVTALRESWDRPNARVLVDRIERSVSALDHLFDALLDISKLDAGVIAPQVEPFALQPMLQRLESEYGQAAEEKGLSLHVEACAVAVRSDPRLLERVLRNLFSNAVRYTTSGGVTVECFVGRDQVRIEVVDTGIGIAQQHLDDIFQEFYQVDNLERDRGKGLGLGLAIVKRVCKLLGHAIAVRSTPGLGSAFAIEVPADEMVTAAPPSLDPEEAALQGAFVLVVDDEADVVEATATLLSASGCHILTGASGAEAVHALSRQERIPDAVVSDYRLRAGETGLEVIATIHNTIGEHIPAVLITGDTSPERLREAAASGYHILHKPVDPYRLRRLLALEIAATRTRREEFA